MLVCARKGAAVIILVACNPVQKPGPWVVARLRQVTPSVRHGMEYVDPGASFYETRYRTRIIDNLHRRAKAFGFVLQPTEPEPGAAVS